MTAVERARWLAACPVLFHMTAEGAWPSIRASGLLSTTALLDRHAVGTEARARIEATRRDAGVRVGPALIRDQLPMTDAALRRCLVGGLAPSDWYRALNRRVFFWPNRARLDRLLGAKPYRHEAHDVLEIDAAPLIDAYEDAITLSPINSGSTRRAAQPRGADTFRSIAAFPWDEWRGRRSVAERVVEITVDHAVPDIGRFVSRVTRRRGTEILSVLFERQEKGAFPVGNAP